MAGSNYPNGVTAEDFMDHFADEELLVCSECEDEVEELVEGLYCESCNRKLGAEEDDYRLAKDRDEWRHEAVEQQRIK